MWFADLPEHWSVVKKPCPWTYILLVGRAHG